MTDSTTTDTTTATATTETSPPPAPTLLGTGLAVLGFARKATLALCEDLPQDKWLWRVQGKGNHALWILGHIAVTDDWFLRGAGSQPAVVDANWNELFGMGSTPTENAADYPSVEEVQSSLRAAREALTNWFGSMSETDLVAPLPGDFTLFAPNFAVMMSTIAWHEGIHTGQLSTIRRSLGFAPKFG